LRIESGELLSGRETILGSNYAQAVKENQFTVYLGIYNGDKYLPPLLEHLQGQKDQNFPLIIVDNHSHDGSWTQVKNWPSQVRERAKLIRNPLNLGGTGSLALNFNEIETPWFVTMHQDDTYGPNHISVLSQHMESSLDSDIVVFTDMGSQSMEGKKLFTPIRQSWIANLETPQSTFRANLLQQSVSYPSAAFRTSAFARTQIPWHSSSFPDTERTLLQASMGTSKFVPKLTMLYRMNPKSESHDLNNREKVLGPFAALSRVMASDSFMKLCAGVPVGERGSFSKGVFQGIDIRLGESAFSEIVKLIAAETMGLAWDYSDSLSRAQIYETYKIAEDGRTTKLLEDLGVFFTGTNQAVVPGEINQKSKAQSELEYLLDQATPASNAPGSKSQLTVLIFLGRLLPLPIRRKVVSLLVRLHSRFYPESPWNLAWKPKS
jgi:glycosyltransferase involved in cell wall biosynthesis